MESDRTSTSRSDSISDNQPKARPLHGRTYGPSRRSTKGQWTPEEDKILSEAVQRFQGKNWKKIAQCFKDRSDVQCLHRWQKVLNPELVKGPWSKEEDDAIVELVKKYGPTKWSTIAQHLPGRIGKQCRERWHNHLNPNINKEAWTQEEELALIRAHQIYGNKWAELTKYLPGRSDNAIKNHWNSSVKKKLDSYMASGLLAQFQSLPNPIQPIQKVANSSKTSQTSEEDDSFARNGLDIEEVSQCSQGSGHVGFSRSTNDVGITDLPTGEEYFGYNLPVEWGTSLENHMSGGQLIHSLSAQFHHLSTFGGQNCTPYSVNMASGTEIIGPETFQSGTMDGSSDSLHYQSSSYQFPIDGPSFCQTFPEHSQPISDPSTLIYGGFDPIFFNDSTGHSEQNIVPVPESNDSFINGCDSLSHFNEHNACMQEQLYQGSDTSRLLPNHDSEQNIIPVQEGNDSFINGCGSLSHFNEHNASMQEQLDQGLDTSRLISDGDFAVAESSEQKDSGALFYEPPRFPSFDVPFFSCDLSQPNSEMQQEYSPLGIRQLMISSSLSPFKLWGDSPLKDKSSPEAVLKNAAKTFTCTPSILKKRHRDLLSPLSEKRCEKRFESTSNMASFSSLARDFSRLEESTFSDGEDEDKENKAPPDFIKEEKEKDSQIGLPIPVYGSFQKDTNGGDSDVNMKQLGGDIDSKSLPKSEAVLQSAVVCSPRSEGGANLSIVPAAMNPTSSEKIENLRGNITNLENFSLFGGTPFRRSMDSPSAWKSPWFVNSFLPGQRVDTDICMEDMEFFMSPVDRSYDALGLMKELSEQTASAFATAQEVLGNETPKTEINFIHSKEQNKDDKEGTNIVECRTLDFSECGTTPKKVLENGTSSSSSSNNDMRFSTSSSSSYLLKGCR